MSHKSINSTIIINNEQKYCLPFSMKDYVDIIFRYLKINYDYIEITLLSSDKIKEMNEDYFHNQCSTDTITFNLTEESNLIGDIYISPDVIEGNAKQYNHSYEKELKIVIIHSILHLLGFSDESELDFRKMEKKQQKIYEEIVRSKLLFLLLLIGCFDVFFILGGIVGS